MPTDHRSPLTFSEQELNACADDRCRVEVLLVVVTGGQLIVVPVPVLDLELSGQRDPGEQIDVRLLAHLVGEFGINRRGSFLPDAFATAVDPGLLAVESKATALELGAGGDLPLLHPPAELEAEAAACTEIGNTGPQRPTLGEAPDDEGDRCQAELVFDPRDAGDGAADGKIRIAHPQEAHQRAAGGAVTEVSS